MKKLALVVVLISGITLSAQRHQGDRGTMQDLSPQEIATLQTKKMTLALDLDQKQQTEVQSLFLTNATERKNKMDERKSKKEDGNRPSKEERYAMQNERLDHMIAQKASMKKILTEAQFEKWEKMQLRRQKGKRERKGRKSRG